MDTPEQKAAQAAAKKARRAAAVPAERRRRAARIRGALARGEWVAPSTRAWLGRHGRQ